MDDFLQVVIGAAMLFGLVIAAALSGREKKKPDGEIESFPPNPGIPVQINAPEPQKAEPAPSPLPPVATPTAPPAAFQWDTAKHAYHSVRVICDEMGLSVEQKNVLCACIYQESTFLNYRAPGVPTTNKNRRPDGTLSSTDWGICQINDTKGWHIGPGLSFPSVQDVLDNPEKAVRYMVRMYKAGKLGLWSSFKFGHYKKWLATSSPMWALKP